MTEFSCMGRIYQLEYADDLTDETGSCDDPALYLAPKIRIGTGLTSSVELETIIHEFTHAANYKVFSEEYVTEFAKDLAGLLLRLGWKNG